MVTVVLVKIQKKVEGKTVSGNVKRVELSKEFYDENKQLLELTRKITVLKTYEI